MRKTKVAPSREKLMQLYVEDEYTITEIAHIFAVGRTTVTKWLLCYDIPTRNQKQVHIVTKKWASMMSR